MSGARIETASLSRLAAWSAMRATLWPSASVEEHAGELTEWLAKGAAGAAAFLAVTPDGDTVGFAEAALRRDYVNGCETTPVAFSTASMSRRLDGHRARTARSIRAGRRGLP